MVRGYLKWQWRVSHGCRMLVGIRTLTGVVHVVVSLLFIYVCKHLVDIATSTIDSNMKPFVLLLVLCMLLQQIFSIAGQRLDVHACIRMGNKMKFRLFHHVMESKWNGRENIHTGDLMTRFNGDVDIVASLLCHSCPSIVVSVVQLLSSAFFLGFLDLKLALIVVVLLPAAFLLSKSYMKRMRRLTYSIREADSKLQALTQEYLQHKVIVSTLEFTRMALNSMDLILQDLKIKVLKRTDYSLFSKIVVQGGFSLGYIIAFLWGVYGIKDGSVSVGMMTAFLQLVAQIQHPVSGLGRQIPEFVHAYASFERLKALERLPLEERGEPVSLSGVIGVTMENVSFSYTDEGKQVFSNFTHDFKPGSLTAVIGETGVGKSTLIRMLLALVIPQKGHIRFYTEACESEVVSPMTRCNVVYVPQGNSLMSGTIRDNLSLGNPQASEEQIQKALYTACAEFVYALPEGLDTLCGEQGNGLSEGQAQRIAIARGLLRPGGLLLMDEPTSSLDEETEILLMHRLSEKLYNKTLIMVTHREKCAKFCTSVLHLR